MNVPQGWQVVPFATLKERRVALPRRFSVSLSLSSLFPPGELAHELVEREGLGPWKVLALSSDDLGWIVVGSPEHGGDELGASVWVEEGVGLTVLKRFLGEASTATGYDVVDADG